MNTTGQCFCQLCRPTLEPEETPARQQPPQEAEREPTVDIIKLEESGLSLAQRVAFMRLRLGLN